MREGEVREGEVREGEGREGEVREGEVREGEGRERDVRDEKEGSRELTTIRGKGRIMFHSVPRPFSTAVTASQSVQWTS